MKIIRITTVIASILSLSLNAGEASVRWSEPENYTDVEAVEQPQKKYQQRIFKKLDKHLNKLSKRLPQGQKLKLTVTDLDLAGKVLPGYAHGIDSPRDIRTIKGVYYPKIEFSYQLLDTTGAVLASGNEEIKDLAFQDRIQTRRMARDSLAYEKRMLTNWFNETFARKITKK